MPTGSGPWRGGSGGQSPELRRGRGARTGTPPWPAGALEGRAFPNPTRTATNDQSFAQLSISWGRGVLTPPPLRK